MEELELFMRVVAEEDFVQGHEVLEDKWREWKNIPHKKEESFILKGLINGSTALALERLGRHESALRVWGTFEKYRPYILSVESPYTKDYQEAEALLVAKYQAIIVKD